MTITIKSKELQKPVQKQIAIELNPNIEVVEEMATLSIQLDAFKVLEAKYNSLKKALLEQIPEDATEFEPYTFAGINHKVVFSACSKKREITDMEKAKAALGAELFMKIAKIGLTDLDKYLSVEEKEQFIVESQTGARNCSVKEQ